MGLWRRVVQVFTWAVLAAPVVIPFSEAILGLHLWFQSTLGIGSVGTFCLAYTVSMLQLYREWQLARRVGPATAQKLHRWWSRSRIRNFLLVSLASDADEFKEEFQSFFVVCAHLTVFGLSAHPIVIPVPHPFGRSGAVALWYSTRLRGGGITIALGSLVRLLIVYAGILALQNHLK